MFKSAVIKLTAWQVSALLLVCLLFSIPAYNIAAERLRHGAEQQTQFIARYREAAPAGLVPFLEQRREEQLGKDRHELLISLVLLNSAILALGTVGSYLFARRTLRPIEEAHAAQSRFTADASHELRTPLATMQTEIDVALRDPSLRLPEAKQVLRSNLEDIARLHSLSEQLLYLTRMDAKDVAMSVVDLNKIIKSEVKRLEKQHSISISVSVAKILRLRANTDLIEQLISILVDNAVKYAGETPPKISVLARQTGKRIELQVTDEGVGIAPAELPFIFDRFYRGSRASKQTSDGHGLGLALAKAIVQAHDGEITARSDKQHGTVMTITLPAA